MIVALSWKIKYALKKVRIYLVILAALLAIGLVGYSFIYTELLMNMQTLGTSSVRNYALEEDNKLTVYKTLVSYATVIIDKRVEEVEGAELDDIIDRSMHLYFERVLATLGNNAVDPYIVYNGKIIAANPWSGDMDYDYENSPWYKMTVGTTDTAFTDVYTDAIYDRPVVTVAQRCKTADAVVAFDIFPAQLDFTEDILNLPEHSSIYLCDKNGVLICSNSSIQNTVPQETIGNYIKELLVKIENGDLDSFDSFVTDPENNRRGVYYYTLSNGWTAILTTPYNSILSSLNSFTLIFLIIFGLCLIAVAAIAAMNLKLNAMADRNKETVTVLGNMHYAIYRVNYIQETYEMIKGSDYVKRKILKTRNYSDFLKTVSEIIDPAAKEEFLTSFSCESIKNLVAKNIKDFGGDFKRDFDGEYKWVNVRLLFDKSLAPYEAILCFREIEQEKRAQLQQQELLENALASAQKNSNAKQAFFSNMSHDMRTPLNAITGYSELALTSVEDTEKTKDYISKIRYSAQSLLNLVNDILEMSRIEQGKLTLTNTVLDLKECIEQCCDVFEHQAQLEKKHFELSFDIHERLVYGDAFRITQIMNNLLSNAFKFTAEGDSVTVSVKQLEFRKYSKYQIIISDTGIGMSKEFLPTLFEPYSREMRFESKKANGTGLGMPIVKSLVVHMSGQIDVKSELGKGTVFTVTIPFTTADENKKEEKSEAAPKSADTFSLKGMKILIAEDNMLNMEIASEILSMNGVEVAEAWNGEEAVEMFKSSAPFEFDAILMDMQMPQMDGCEAAKHIRCLQRPDAKLIPIIAVTANAFAEDISATIAAGMNSHISKPIDYDLLRRVLHELTTDYAVGKK